MSVETSLDWCLHGIIRLATDRYLTLSLWLRFSVLIGWESSITVKPPSRDCNLKQIKTMTMWKLLGCLTCKFNDGRSQRMCMASSFDLQLITCQSWAKDLKTIPRGKESVGYFATCICEHLRRDRHSHIFKHLRGFHVHYFHFSGKYYFFFFPFFSHLTTNYYYFFSHFVILFIAYLMSLIQPLTMDDVSSETCFVKCKNVFQENCVASESLLLLCAAS